jgi:hypothetical protein
MSGVAPEHPQIFAARADAYNRISDFIVRTYKSKRWGGLVLVAEYGNGKTHTLKLIRDQINLELGKTPEGDTLAIYVENLGQDLVNFYFEILREVGLSLIVAMLWKIFLQRIGKKLTRNFVEKLRPSQIPLTAPKTEDLPRFFASNSLLKTAIERGYFSKVLVFDLISNELKEIIPDHDLRKSCCILLIESDEEIVDLSWRYFSGRTLTSAQTNKIGVSKSAIKEEDVQREAFQIVLNIFRAASVVNVYLLIDEIEDLMPLPRQRKRYVLGGLRSIIENNQDNFAMFLATTEVGWRDLDANSPPLADRFPNLVNLPPLNLEQTKELIEGYLSMAREKEVKDPLFPFSDKLVEKIWEASGGNLRKILETCYQLLENGSSKKVITLTMSLIT